MVSIIFIGLLVLVSTVGLVVGLVSKKKDDYDDYSRKGIGYGVAVGTLVLALLIGLFSSMFFVSSRTVGVVTEFGKATGTVEPGLNFLAPWAEVTEFPTSNQNLDLDNTDKDNQGRPIEVKFDGGGTGYINININWKVKGNDQAIKLWTEWKEFGKVREQVVTKRVQSIGNKVVGAYQPQDAIESANYEHIETAIKKALSAELNGQGIDIADVNVIRVDVDKDTQARINKQAAAKADIITAQSKQERAVIDNETKRLTQESLTSAALTDKCLEMVNNWDAKKNGNLPSGFSCFLATGLPLTIPAK